MRATTWIVLPVLGFVLVGASGVQRVGSVGAARVDVSYFVSLSGKDSNPGTRDRPWRTVQHAAERLRAGQTVYIEGGRYAERVEPKHSGAPGRYITYTAYPGQAPVVDGARVGLPADQAGLFDIRDRAYIRVSGLRIANAHGADNSNGILVLHSHDIVLERNRTSNTRSSGIGVWESRSVIVAGNNIFRACLGPLQESLTIAGTDTFDVKNNTIHGTGRDKEGISAKGDAQETRHGKIHGNVVYDVPAVGIYVDAESRPESDISVYSNVVHDIKGTPASIGIALADEAGGLLTNVRVYNNIVYDNAIIGVLISRTGVEGVRHPMQDLQIINNTLYRNGNPWGGGFGIDNPDARDVVVRNNIASSNRSFQLSVSTDIPRGNVVVDHNLIDGYRHDREDGEVLGTNYILGNPLFVNANRANFHLRRGSPAVDKGSALDAPSTDFDGRHRPRGAGYDIGAYEDW